jgi:hypothetical protein
MVNLRGIVNPATSFINPNVGATLRRNTGYNTAASGKRTPIFQDVAIQLQVQSLTKSEIQHLDGLNIQGVGRAAYFYGHVFGLVRAKQAGGDMIVFPEGTFPEGNEWLCVHVLEQWPDWGKVAITLQNPGT